MKKIIATFAMIISIISVAGVKEDLEKASSLLQANKRNEAIAILKKIRPKRSELKEMPRVYYALFELSDSSEDKIKYLKLASSDKNTDDQFAVSANEILANSEENLNKKLALLRELNQRTNYGNLVFVERETYILYLLGRDSEAERLNKYIDEKGTLDNKKAYYYDLMNALYTENKTTPAVLLFNKAVKLDSRDYQYMADLYIALAKYSKDDKKILGYASRYLEAIKLTKENKALILGKLFLVSVKLNDVNKEAKYLKELLKEKITYTQMAIYLYNNDNSLLEKAKSYARLAVKYREKDGADILRQLESKRK
ncbi:hypothetical protein [Oceanivirga salmonicida]|uniref:hypothetical protein n=1 Tax=Oceanivirga salmonicida TaxID=1769291 RepID=UPI0012E1BACB|nr:hypothetical protein [Oceanivirga salmonicida]